MPQAENVEISPAQAKDCISKVTLRNLALEMKWNEHNKQQQTCCDLASFHKCNQTVQLETVNDLINKSKSETEYEANTFCLTQMHKE